MWTRGLKIKKYNAKGIKNQNDCLVIEKDLTLILNKKTITTFKTIPSKEKALAIGHLVSNQLITSPTNITQLTQTHDSIEVVATTIANPPKPEAIPKSDLKVTRINIFHLTAYLQENAILFKDTAITESAAIANTKAIIYFAEDLNRLNAINKAIGLALEKQEDFSDKILLTSGKVDQQVVNKALTLGIPTIVSRTGPTDKAFDLATEKNITILGFARGTRFNLYTTPKRISLG
jgi:FdhD protein